MIDGQKAFSTIDAIIPAYNEAPRIAGVLKPLLSCAYIGRIIVVDDGSADDTERIATRMGAMVIRHPVNRGKAAAVCTGALAARTRYVLLLDADLIGLHALHVRAMVEPVLFGSAQSTLGLFAHGRLSTDLAQYAFPMLSGQRVVERTLVLDQKERIDGCGYGLEVRLERALRQAGVRPQRVTLEHVTHAMKEEKAGFSDGVKWRARMFKEILNGYARR